MGRRALVMLASVCAVAAITPLGAQPQRVRTVLAVFWSSEEFPPSASASDILRETLQSEPDQAIDFFAEYFESDRFAGAAHEEAFRDYLVHKYAGRTIDVVIAQTDAVLRFVTAHRDTMFPDAPIVHSGVSAPDPEMRRSGAGITSLVNAPVLAETLAVALRLHPATRRVHVILHVPDSDGRTEESVRSQLKPFESAVQIDYPNPPTLDSLLSFVRTVPPDHLILHVRWSSEESGRVMMPVKAAHLVAKNASAPVYVAAEAYLGTGAVGGTVYSFSEIGQRLSATVLQVLRGTRVQDIPEQLLTAVPTFDAQQLSRWRVAESALPAGSRLVNRDVSGWARYRWYIAGAVGFAGVEAVMIGALMLQGSRRRESEARNSAILRCQPDLMFLQTADGVFLDYYARDQRRLFVPPEQFLGHRMRDVLPADMARTFEQRFLEVSASPNAATDDPVTLEYELPMPDGTRHFEARFVACEGQRVLSIIRDVTDRKRADESLRHTQEALANAIRLSTLGEFAASIAHELNQPLAVITMNSNLSLKWSADGEKRLPQIRAALEDVVAATTRASDIIQHARRVYRQRELEVGAIDVTELIEGACTIVKRRLKVAGVSVSQEVTPHLMARADRVAMRGVLLNLIVNAIEAMETVGRARRHLTIRSGIDSAGRVEVSVSDTGPGIGGIGADALFRTGYTTKPDGMGIGLSTSRAIIEALGGRISAIGNDAGGATFTFTIPAEPGAGPGNPAA